MLFKTLIFSLGSLFTTMSLAAINDGPYVSWLDKQTLAIEAVCQSQVRSSRETVTQGFLIKNPCTQKVVAPLIPQHAIPLDSFTNVQKYLAVSDVEGHYQELLALLKKHGIIDSADRWIWGEGHLVFVGDSVDRGQEVTEVLWLIYRLQSEAELAGGKVHFLLGNHDTFAVEGDDRYLHDKYQESFALLGRGYAGFFAKDTEFGRWFRSRNILLKLNDTLFVHGGLKSDVTSLNLSVSDINRYVRAGLETPSLEKSNAKVKWLMGSDGPLWYRGYFQDEDLTSADIKRILQSFRANRIVVGHTIVPELAPSFDAQVIGIDTAFSKRENVSALLFEEGRYYRAKISGKTPIDLK